MKKTLILAFLCFLFSNTSFAESYFFKGCKISEAVIGNYVINLKENVIEVQLIREDGIVQNFSDKIKLIEKNKIVSEKIKSGKDSDLYYQYFLNSKSKSVIKLEYKKESGIDMEMFKLNEKRVTYCMDVRGGWDKAKLEKVKISKEQKEILKTQEKLKKEQETIVECQSSNFNEWSNCKGSYTAETGHKYNGIFKDGKILKGISIYPGGAKYVGEFKDYKPNGYGTFVWTNGDKYYGEWKSGKSHGNGTKIWKDGRKYLGKFKDDKLHWKGTRHGEGIFIYSDGSAYIGNFISGKEHGVGECVKPDGTSVKCKGKTEAQALQDFSGKDTQKISIVAKKWVRISQYEANSKKGKKIMDKLKSDFEVKAKEICSPKSYDVLEKKIEVLEIDETPAYGLETKLKIGIDGAVECK